MTDDADLHRWFCREVLPLEAALMRYIRRNCSNPELTADIRQDVYAAAIDGARRGLPVNSVAYVYTIARNLLINRAKRSRLVSFELIASPEVGEEDFSVSAIERHLVARESLRRAQEGLERLPPRCREVVTLRKVHGYSTQETAEHLGVGIHTVERQLTMGMRALVDFMFGGSGKLVRHEPVRRRSRRTAQ